MTKLYEHPFSPYAQKVKIALYEKNVPFELEVPNAFSGAATEYLKLNPRLEVPTLVDGGLAIFDSTIILEYVEQKWPTPAMLPASAADRARVRMIEEICDTYYEAINWGLMEVRAWGRASGDLAARLTRRAEEQTAGVYRWLERELGNREYFNGSSFGWGDLSVFPFVNGSVVWGLPPKKESALARWLETVGARDSVRRTVAAAREFQGGIGTLQEMLKTGAFKRQYRDHRLEWMMRSGGVEIVLEGMKKNNIRFQEEIR